MRTACLSTEPSSTKSLAQQGNNGRETCGRGQFSVAYRLWINCQARGLCYSNYSGHPPVRCMGNSVAHLTAGITLCTGSPGLSIMCRFCLFRRAPDVQEEIMVSYREVEMSNQARAAPYSGLAGEIPGEPMALTSPQETSRTHLVLIKALAISSYWRQIYKAYVRWV